MISYDLGRPIPSSLKWLLVGEILINDVREMPCFGRKDKMYSSCRTCWKVWSIADWKTGNTMRQVHGKRPDHAVDILCTTTATSSSTSQGSFGAELGPKVTNQSREERLRL